MANFVFWQNFNLSVFEDILQGRAQSPTGGESPRIPSNRDRSGATPGPTVKVWMEEEFLRIFLFYERVIVIDL
jgi:hypothetical protein